MAKKLNHKQLSVVIPVYNEELSIANTIKAVRRSPIKSLELIVVDDGSTDNTRKILETHEGYIDHLVFKKENQGKGSALQVGFKEATGEVVVVQDADAEYSPENYPRLIKPILDGNADVVYGSRFIGGEPRRIIYFWHYLANHWLTMFSNLLTNLNLSDMETGCKAFRRDIVQSLSLQEKGFGIEPEITVKIAHLKLRVYEVGISYHGRSYEEGKKITFSDAVMALWLLIKYTLISWLS